MDYTFRTNGVCSSQINFSIEDGKLHDVEFIGGCNGNLKAISKLTEGMDADKVADLLEGNTCGMRPTSCADQFAKAIKKAIENEQR